jgi:hypothetical protein
MEVNDFIVDVGEVNVKKLDVNGVVLDIESAGLGVDKNGKLPFQFLNENVETCLDAVKCPVCNNNNAKMIQLIKRENIIHQFNYVYLKCLCCCNKLYRVYEEIIIKEIMVRNDKEKTQGAKLTV